MDDTFLKQDGLAPSYDPYDLWATPVGVRVKNSFYKGKILGRFSAVVLAVIDWVLPIFSRKIFFCEKSVYPISVALEIMSRSKNEITAEESKNMISILRSISVSSAAHNYAWGLGFNWMSKNGLYDIETPFVTHTPYVMESLVFLKGVSSVSEEAINMFIGTERFLDSLLVMHETEEELALSYAPLQEPRIVVNANSYAAFAYALHVIHGRDNFKPEAIEKINKLVRWIVSQQNNDGSWFYYADTEQGNFIDCFHSCFVVKNLIKIKMLIPSVEEVIGEAIDNGWKFIVENFYVENKGLCNRFVERDIRDPFQWDLYDQAEYLGLLLDFEMYDDAHDFIEHVERMFESKGSWYSRIDVFGCKWGKDFLRWGIIPFKYQKQRYINLKES